MLDQIKGLHHVTSMAKDARENNQFFTGRLGLRRVKKTVNFDAPDVYHLYYGDEKGTPGSVMTYFPFPNIGKGRPGAGEVGTTVFAVPAGTLGYWETRLAEQGVSGLARESGFGENRLRFNGPDADGFALVEVADDDRAAWTEGGVPADAAIRGFHSASLRLRDGGATEELLKYMGYEPVDTSGNVKRLAIKGGNGADVIDIEFGSGCSLCRSRRRLRPPHRLCRGEPREAARSAQGADRHGLPCHSGDRPRLFLGDLFPHARRRPVRGRHQ